MFKEIIPKKIRQKVTNYRHRIFCSCSRITFLYVIPGITANLMQCATSAPLELIFCTSTAEYTITPLRASINFSNAADLIFLHDCWLLMEK